MPRKRVRVMFKAFRRGLELVQHPDPVLANEVPTARPPGLLQPPNAGLPLRCLRRRLPTSARPDGVSARAVVPTGSWCELWLPGSRVDACLQSGDVVVSRRVGQPESNALVFGLGINQALDLFIGQLFDFVNHSIDVVTGQ